ncbi:MAG: molecular chaperone TorD family protein [Opitutaceae bacterium]|nr:molecular chaperone TorD family protein [Opitutaceae bacterium]
MTTHPNSAAFRFLSEVLLYPEDRDAQKLREAAELAGSAVPELRETIEAMLASPELGDCDTYLQTFEIEAKCPLYLGHYLFEEPTNCRGAAVSGRNAYMIQLKNLYRHFGLEMHDGELPDYLPLMLDFLALSAGHPALKHRRLVVEKFIMPALPPLTRQLRAASNVYSHVAQLTERLLKLEIEQSNGPASEPAQPDSALCKTT